MVKERKFNWSDFRQIKESSKPRGNFWRGFVLSEKRGSVLDVIQHALKGLNTLHIVAI